MGNRVSGILEVSDQSQWRHVPGSLNLADNTSRGLHPVELKNDHHWFQGPVFLHQNEDRWPQPMDFVRASDGHEVKSRMTHYVAPVVKSPPKSIQMTIMERILSRTNSSVRAIRILA